MTGDERKELREVLLAGSSRDSMTTALAEAENSRVFDDLVGEGGYSSQLRDLIEHAYRGGWLSELVDVFASQTERKELLERAGEIVAAVEGRGPPNVVPDGGNGASSGGSTSTNSAVTVVKVVIFAIAIIIFLLGGYLMFSPTDSMLGEVSVMP